METRHTLRRKTLTSLFANLFGYTSILTIFAVSLYIMYAAVKQPLYPSTGQELGTTTTYDSVHLQDTEEAKQAFKKFCSIRNECTLLMFCKEVPRYCIFPTTTEETSKTDTSVTIDSSITPTTQSDNNFIETYQKTEANTSTESDPTEARKETANSQEKLSTWCYWTRKFQLGGCTDDSQRESEPKRIATITPTPSKQPETSTTKKTAQTQAPASWCYDSDLERSDTSGVCRDATGTYYDGCEGGKVTEYICQGTWNGNEYTDQKCTQKLLSCKSPSICHIGRCYEAVDTSQSVTQIPVRKPSTVITRPAAETEQGTPSLKPEERKTQTKVEQEEVKKELEPPVITAPSSGSTVSGTVSIAVDKRLFSTVTVLLQPLTTVKDQIYLNRIQSSDEAVRWDTTLLPNGDYYLFAIAHGVGQKYISQPAKVTVHNAESVAVPKHSLILPSDFKPERAVVNNVLSIEEVKTTPTDAVHAVTLQGKAEPNTVISVLIYSNPIVVTVRTDANGVWTYTLEEPLEPGNHTAYVVVPKADGSQIRSEINTFFVPPVYASSVDNQNLRSVEESETPLIRNFIILAVILVLDAVMILLLVYHFKSKKNT